MCLKEQLVIVYIFIGDLLCVEVVVGIELGRQVKVVMDVGNLVFDDILLGMLELCLGQVDVVNGFILDGYLCNVVQVNVLDILLVKIGQLLDVVVQLDVLIELLVECIVGCVVEQGCVDDNFELVCQCLQVYNDQIVLVVDFYVGCGMLVCVDGVGELDDVEVCICVVIQC